MNFKLPESDAGAQPRFQSWGVKFLGVGYCTEQNTHGIPSCVHCRLLRNGSHTLHQRSWGGPFKFWGSGPPPTLLPVVAPLIGCARRFLSANYTRALFSVVLMLTTPCLKNVPPLACYNFDAHEWILIFFGRNVIDKVGNQKTLYCSHSSNMCFCTTCQNVETRKSHFHSIGLCYTHNAPVTCALSS